MQLEVGAVLEGKVTGITKFGAFVALPEGKSGLIHISEIANSFVTDIHEFLTEGQIVKVCVLSIAQDGKIALSAKKVGEQAPAHPVFRRPVQKPVPVSAPQSRAAGPYVPEQSKDQSFEDRLRQFMQDSDKKMSGNKLFEQQRKSRSRRK